MKERSLGLVRKFWSRSMWFICCVASGRRSVIPMSVCSKFSVVSSVGICGRVLSL